MEDQIRGIMNGHYTLRLIKSKSFLDFVLNIYIFFNLPRGPPLGLAEDGTCSDRRHGGGRVRSTTPTEDRCIVLSAKRNRRTTAQQVANQFLAASGKQISRKTVARRLTGGGLYARRPVVCVPLTRQHRTARLQWCREHHNWTE
ncbi:HTH_Tnp_Tc3_2 domain-containing protein [Trichonephila clavipes]|nr:HTH_Tnp_Tc3_2 domain-containing protein [Trichonephila clavipes]